MAGLMSPEMHIFCTNNPHLTAVAVTRDAGARAYFGSDYTLYGQGTVKAIGDRAMAPPAGVAATSAPSNTAKMVHCNLCNKDVNDFARHNREHHILDPTQIFYCPYAGCTAKIKRDGQITRDDHLANSHNDFRNMAGRSGELLERSVSTSTLNKLTVGAARFVAHHRQSQVQGYENRRAQLLQNLTTANRASPALQAVTLPASLQQGSIPSFTDLNKTQAIAHAILVRQTLDHWDALLAAADTLLS